ncbi:MAG: isochorismate synthase [Calditrichia bacterium]
MIDLTWFKHRIRESLRSYRFNESGLAPGRTYRVQKAVGSIDLIDWLHQQNFPIKVYWADRSGYLEIAGVGSVNTIEMGAQDIYHAIPEKISLSLASNIEPVRFYGGFCFDRERTREEGWKDFGAARFILPRFELLRQGNETVFACNFSKFDQGKSPEEVEAEIFREVEKLRFPKYSEPPSFPRIVRAHEVPSQKDWREQARSVIKRFNQKTLQKVVLARQWVIEFAETLEPLNFLRQLKTKNTPGYYFYFQPVASSAFLGVSPERLYSRESDEVESEALAGTRPRPNFPRDDQQLAEELRTNPKELREHRLVADFIEENLRVLCDRVECPEREAVEKLAHVQHLKTKFRGTLKSGIGDGDIVQALHPTPAVGGAPREAALQILREVEPFDRGWYAAPIGWLGKFNAELAVGIRSALARENTLTLFAGAGIVPDSDPEKEWEETTHKLRMFTQLFPDL